MFTHQAVLSMNFDPNLVVHPIYDQPEQKLDPSKMGPIKMTRWVRTSLVVLRFYLVAMLGLTLFRCLQLAQVIH